VIDLVVEDPPIEAVIDQIYQEGASLLTVNDNPTLGFHTQRMGANEEETR
jgi:hypothetical protein